MSSTKRWRYLAAGLAMMSSAGLAQAAGDMNSSLDAAFAGDYDHAVQTWMELAAQGDAQAQFNLGLVFHGGVGVERDEGLALEWYQKSAEGGYSKAQAYMVVGYEEGWFGLPKDSKMAYYWRGMLGNEK